MKTKIQLYDTQIRQDEQGRFCLNDLHQASGGESRHRPAYWLSNTSQRYLKKALRNSMSGTQKGCCR
jgi:hypothetical protein